MNRHFLTLMGLACGPALMLGASGCNSEDAANQVPPDSELVASINEQTWDIDTNTNEAGGCVYFDDFYNDTYVRLTMLNDSGVPMGDVTLDFSLDLTGNTFTGNSVLKLYHDANGNGVVDPEELVSDASDPRFSIRTDAYGGYVDVIVRVNLSCPYSGGLYVVGPGGTAEYVAFDVNDRAEVEEDSSTDDESE